MNVFIGLFRRLDYNIDAITQITAHVLEYVDDKASDVNRLVTSVGGIAGVYGVTLDEWSLRQVGHTTRSLKRGSADVWLIFTCLFVEYDELMHKVVAASPFDGACIVDTTIVERAYGSAVNSADDYLRAATEFEELFNTSGKRHVVVKLKNREHAFKVCYLVDRPVAA